LENEFLERLHDRRRIRQQEEKKRKFRLLTIGGTLITAASLATELFVGGVIKPFDAGYLFTSDDVTISRLDGDYHSKSYSVRDSQGFVNNFSFDELESIEPDVHGGYTYLPEELLPNGSHLGIKRVEDNPVKAVMNGAAIMTFIGGGTFVRYAYNEQKDAGKSRR